MNGTFVKTREMTNLEKLSLIHSQLHTLESRAHRAPLSFDPPGYQQVSCLTQQDGTPEQLDHQIQSRMAQQTLRSFPQLQPCVLETITQIGTNQLVFQGLTNNNTSEQASLNAFADKNEQQTVEADKSRNNHQITKLGLKAFFNQVTATVEPNPVSERQIESGIVDLHVRAGLLNHHFPSFDNTDENSHFKNESLLQVSVKRVDSADALPTGTFEREKRRYPSVPTNRAAGESAYVEKSSSEKFVVTTVESNRRIPPENKDPSSVYVNTLS